MKIDKNTKIGVIGVGMVGGAIKRHFGSEGFDTYSYDKGKNEGSINEVNKAEIIFICVPTPFDEKGGFDVSIVEEAVSSVKDGRVVVIKSTVIPGTTDRLQEENPKKKFLFNPEFLREASADEDMKNPDRQIVGYTKKSKDIAKDVLEILPDAPFKKVVPAKEAETVKYFGNTFLSIKVIFAAQMHELCKKIGVDYEIVRECAEQDKRIGPSHLDVHHGGFIGYGWKCFPKDMRAFIHYARENGFELELHVLAEEINNELMREQGIDDPEELSRREGF